MTRAERTVGNTLHSTGAVRSQSPVAGVISRDRLVIASCIVVITALAWTYLVHLSSQKMTMPMSASWTGADFFFTFAMWSVMMIGMMSATAFPVLSLFSGMQKNRTGRAPDKTVLLFGVGYLIVWIGFSSVAALAQWALHEAAVLSTGMATTSSVLAGIVLLLAGAYQLTPTKGACLRQCQSPLGFLMTNWREGAKGALAMGLKHGKYCLGCCWALMCVLFVVGVMNLAWVAALTGFILIEKFGRSGFYVARLGGVAMMAAGILVMN
jgi:predicted metal-binding membrane protein